MEFPVGDPHWDDDCRGSGRNTVIIKPANTAGVIAAKLMELVDEAGFPPGVINYLPSSGKTIGDYLVQHPKTRFINFTGSKDVGLHINEVAAKHQPGQIWIKRVVAEMGGKDFIIVDETADLDKAAMGGIVKSAFGYQGQKCSACSRAIIVDSVYDEVLEKTREMAAELRVGKLQQTSPLMRLSMRKLSGAFPTISILAVKKEELCWAAIVIPVSGIT